MANMGMSGVASGIDTGALVQQLMAIEGKRKANYQVDQMETEQEVELWGGIESQLEALNSSIKALADIDSMDNFSTSVSDKSLLDVSVLDSAQEGAYSIEIGQLATSERIVHGGSFEYSTDYVSEGNFIYSYNDIEVEIAVGANTTLEGLVDLINNSDLNPGVRASLLEYDDGTGRQHLVLSGRDSGSDYTIKINSANTEVLKSQQYKYTDETGSEATATADVKLSEISDFDGLVGSTLTITATDHSGAAMDVSFDISEHSTLGQLADSMQRGFGDLARVTLEDGVITVVDTTSGTSSLAVSYVNDSAATINFAQEKAGGSVVSGMTEFIDPGAFTVAQTANDSKIRVDGFPAGQWIESSSNSVSNVIEGVTLNLADVTDDGDSVMVSISRDRSKVKKKVNAMINSFNEITNYLKDASDYNAETGVAGPLIGDSTTRSLIQELRSPFLGTAVGFGDNDEYSFASQIGIEIDSEGLLELDDDVFDNAVGDNFYALLDLLGSSGKGNVSGTGAISSNVVFESAQDYTTPGEYDIEVTVLGGVLTEARIRTVGDTQWRDADIVDGKILGSVTAKDSDDQYYPERGLVLGFNVDGLADGTHQGAKVTIKQGVAGTLSDIVDKYVDGSDSVLSIKKESLNDLINRTKELIEKEDDRLSKTETRLKQKYARLESQLQSMQQNQQVTSMMGMMYGSS